ncbi:TRAP-type C4-dicarboxylate transport system, small permease component [Brevibacterium sandarakinum]|uniref:TRAP-type C4-dicarboxylate transport system, small permease component n=1 Tax=Brevibacterium sandarakinum TaxID=629680 RepID=A0A1H1SAU8_BRESA|nr:TRAP transporter small permease [Brevibacterium sandarakinum]SDS44876.1 TRAP-type C4-dicarboxylate transport system, small permease component [Brevibacterium sandarakinum]
MRPNTRLNSAWKYVERAGAYLAGLAVGAMVVTTTIEIISRNLFTSSISWVFEFQVQYLMIIAYFMSVSYAQLRKDHIYIELLTDRIRGYSLKAATILNKTVCLAITGLLTYYSFTLLEKSIRTQSLGQPSLPWPEWTSDIFLLIGFGMITVRFCIELVQSLRAKPDHNNSAAPLIAERDYGSEGTKEQGE